MNDCFSRWRKAVSRMFLAVFITTDIVVRRRGLSGRGSAQQKATHHHHSQAARDAQTGLQQQPEACETRAGAAESGHGSGHEGSASVVPEQVSTRHRASRPNG
jgi:hypothetical protein